MIGLLDFFEKPNSLKQAKDAFSIASDVIQFLVKEAIVVPVKDSWGRLSVVSLESYFLYSRV
jgi:hypothetical protein